jgi:hypothetical protein
MEIKNKLKKISAWSVTLCIAVLLMFTMTANAADYSDTGWSFSLNAEPQTGGTLTVFSNAGTTAWRTGRGSETFEIADVTNLIIESGVTSINNEAFRNTRLTTVTIPSSVTFINWGAFTNAALTSVAFESETPPSFSTSPMFNSNPNLTNVFVPTNSCTAYRAIAVLSGEARHTSCVVACEVCDGKDFSGRGWLFGNGTLIVYNSVGTTGWRTGRGSETFEFADVTNIIIESGVTSIGSQAFQNTQLTSVTIPSSVTSISWGAFTDAALTSVTFESETPPAFSTSAMFNLNPNLANIFVPTNSCTAYRAITLLSGEAWHTSCVVACEVCDGTDFSGNGWLFGNGTLTVYNNIGTTGWRTGRGSETFEIADVTNIIIESGVTSINNEAFRNTQLTSVTIPSNITSISWGAFTNAALTSVTFERETPPSFSTSAMFNLNPNLTNIFVPTNSCTAYRAIALLSEEAWHTSCVVACEVCDGKNFSGRGWLFGNGTLTVYNNVGTSGWRTGRGSETFQFADVTNIIIESGVTTINGDAFRNTRLTTVTIPTSVTNISWDAFTNAALTSVTFLGVAPPAFSQWPIFNDNPLFTTVYVPIGAAAAYHATGRFAGIDIVEIIPSITITAHPQNISVTEGAITQSLSVAAIAAPVAPLNYQWYQNTAADNISGTIIHGATSTTFAVPADLSSGVYYFYAVISAAGFEAVTSDVATVRVNIDSPPTGITDITGAMIVMLGLLLFSAGLWVFLAKFTLPILPVQPAIGNSFRDMLD